MYRKRGSRQYYKRDISAKALSSFARQFSRDEYRRWRNAIISEINRKARQANDEKLSEYYQVIVGKKPEPIEVKHEITLSSDRVTAFAPAGTLNKKTRGEKEKMRRGLLKIFRSRGRRVKAKPIEHYKKHAKDGFVKIGKSYVNVNYLVSALRTLGKGCYIYEPKKKAYPVIVENENGDRIFIAAIAR